MKLKNTNKLALRALALAATLTTAHATAISATPSPFLYNTPGVNADSITSAVSPGTITIASVSTLIGNAAATPVTINLSNVTLDNFGTLQPSGAVAGITVLGGGSPGTITNEASGLIQASGGAGISFTALTAGADLVTNSGRILGTVGVDFAGLTAPDTLTMTGGSITALTTTAAAPAGFAVNFGGGDDTLNLSGGTISGNLDGGAGTDKAFFSGTGIATITGNVLNFETIQKDGTGTTTISGVTSTPAVPAVTAATSITVNAGILNIVGATNTNAITVGTALTAGILNQTGNVTTGVAGTATAIQINNGWLNGVGTVWNATIAQSGGFLNLGSLALTPTGGPALKFNVTGGNLLTHVNPVTRTNDQIVVTGNASITGGATILVSPSNLSVPLQSTTSPVLVATSLSGSYASAGLWLETTDTSGLIATPGLGAFTSSTMVLSVVGTGVDQNVKVVHRYDLVPGLSSFGQQFGLTLNNLVATSAGNSVVADFLAYLDYSNAAVTAGAMNGYEPTDFQASQAYAAVSSREIHRIVEQQNAGDRLFPSSNHAWANYNYSDNSNSGTSNRITAGVGTAIDSFHFGALVSYADGNVSSATDITSLSYGAYLGMGGATGWQLNGYIGGSHAEETTHLNAINYKPAGDGFQALLSGGYMIDQGFCTWGPTLGMEYNSAKLDGSINPGAGVYAMNYSADKLESLRSLLGLRAEFTATSNVRPYVSAEWAHEYEGTADGYTATFLGSTFAVRSPLKLAENSIILRAGVIVGFGETWFGDIGYLGELATDSNGNDYNGLNVGLHGSF